MIFQLLKWHFSINWYAFEKRWADVFQIYPSAIHFNPPQVCPSSSLLSFPMFCLSPMFLSHYFVISVHSMTIWTMLKLPKIAWPSPFKVTQNTSKNAIDLWPLFGDCSKDSQFRTLFFRTVNSWKHTRSLWSQSRGTYRSVSRRSNTKFKQLLFNGKETKKKRCDEFDLQRSFKSHHLSHT